jgi:hypothetical protein
MDRVALSPGFGAVLSSPGLRKRGGWGLGEIEV